MPSKSKIEWTEYSWNPTIGCNKISEGCKNCYAENLADLFKKRGFKNYEHGFKLKLLPEKLSDPYKLKTESIIFVNSMSDLLHEEIPDDYIKDIFRIMNSTPQHTYQILTKRPSRLISLKDKVIFSDNIWLGTSIESQKHLTRFDYLSNTSSSNLFISFEPLIENIRLNALNKLKWVIVGGESGQKARVMKPEWVRAIKDYCQVNNIKFFFKQWGSAASNPFAKDPTKSKKHPAYARGGCLLDGKIYRECPF